MPTPDTTRAPPYHPNSVDSRHNQGIGMPAEHIEEDVQVEITPLRGPEKLANSPAQQLIRSRGHALGLLGGRTPQLSAALANLAVLVEQAIHGANQLWSWDIPKLLGPAKWSYFYLYVLLDVFSRYVTGWVVAYRERAELAKRLIADSCKKQNIQPGQLTPPADPGTSMRSKPVALLPAAL